MPKRLAIPAASCPSDMTGRRASSSAIAGSLAAERLIGPLNHAIGSLARFGVPQRVEKARCLDHPAQSRQHAQMRSRVATDHQEKQIAELAPRRSERNSRERPAERDYRLAHIRQR